MKVSYERVMKRVSAAEGEKSKWVSYLDDIYGMFLPNKSVEAGENSEGQSNQLEVFDSTAQDSLADYASRMESQLVPAGREWMQLEAGTDIPEDQEEEVSRLLEDNTKILFSHIASSNFSSQINECFLDLGISTGAIIIEEGDGIQSSLRFRAVPVRDILIERSTLGIVETVFRKLKTPAGDLTALFPQIKPDGKLSRLIDEKPETEIEVIEGVMINRDNKTYTSVVLYEAEKSILYQEQSKSSPWVVFR